MFINEVELYTDQLDALHEFYVNHVGFSLLEKGEDHFSIKVGDSVMVIKQVLSDRKPFYHMAWNIPDGVFDQAKEWARSKARLTTEDGEDEVYFEHMDTRSCYFLDPASNLIELTSRSTSPQKEENAFSVEDVLNISEINLTTNEVLKVGALLKDFGIDARDGDKVEPEYLNFFGQREEGAFILLGREGRRWIFSDLLAETHPLTIHVDGRLAINVDEQGEVSIQEVG